MKLRDAALLFVLAAIWGAAFLFVRVAVPVLGPFPLVASRLLLARAAVRLCQRHQTDPELARPLAALPHDRHLQQCHSLRSDSDRAAPPDGVVRLPSERDDAAVQRRHRRAVDLGSADGAQADRPGLGIVGVGVIVGWQQQQVDAVGIVSVLLMFVSACCTGSPPSTARSPSRGSARSSRPPASFWWPVGWSCRSPCSTHRRWTCSP